MSQEQRTAAADAAVWYVVRVKRHRERLTQRSLEEKEIASYLPQMAQWPRPAVGSAVGPLFPGYLFVHTVMPAGFHQIIWTPGVRDFVSFGGAPAPLDTSVIEFLRGREGPDGLIRQMGPEEAGNEVQIIRGPFRGLTAVVEERLPARERVRVLMEILQRATRVELPERWVARL